MQRITDLLLILLINFIWATQVPVIRMIGDRLGPLTVSLLPIIVSTLLFIPFLLAENRRRGVKLPPLKDLRYFIVPGLVGIFFMQYLYTVGASKTLAANAGIITLTIPVLVAVFAVFLLKERFNIVRVAGFIIAIAGVLIISTPDILGADFSGETYLKGNLIFFLACVCCGYYNTYCKVLVNKGYTELQILVYASVVGCLFSIPMLIWVEPFRLSTFMEAGSAVIWGILELSLLVYGFSMLLFFYVLRRMDITQAILGNYLLPFFIALLGVVLLREQVTMEMALGGAVIFISTLLVTVYEERLLALWRTGAKRRQQLPD